MHVALCFLLLGTLIQSISATAPPAASEPQADDSTPAGFMHFSSKAMPAGGIERARSFYHATNPREQTLREEFAQYMLAIMKLADAAHQKWGQQADDDITHAFGQKTDSDLDHARIKTDGDHAQIFFQGEEDQPLHLIRDDGHWRIDVSATIKGMDERAVSDIVRYTRESVQLANQLARNLKNEQYDSAASLVKAASDGMARINDTDSK